jgi:hypothetical protein
VQTPTKDNSNNSKDHFYQELQQVFDPLPTYRVKITLNFHAKLQTEDVFKPTAGNESLHENRSDSGFIRNLATSKDLVIRNITFPR